MNAGVFQTTDPIFAAAVIALGVPWKYASQKHIPVKSQAHTQVLVTFYLYDSPSLNVMELYTAHRSGELLKKSPGHDFFYALAGIENYLLRTGREKMRLSLLPISPSGLQLGVQRACRLKVSRPNDGNLLTLARGEAGTVPLLPIYAAALDVAGIPSKVSSDGRVVHVSTGPSLTFHGLTGRECLGHILRMDETIARAAQGPAEPLTDAARSVEISDKIGDFPPGSHPLQLAYAALLTYQGLLTAWENHRTLLLTSQFSALIPKTADAAEQALTARFLAQGGSVFREN